jgi:hypothetical protein
MFQLSELRFPWPNCPGPGAGRRGGLGRSAFALLAVVAGTGCASMSSDSSGDTPTPPLEDIVVFHRAESDLAKQLGIEVIRLRADLRRAEEALIEVDSGLRGSHTRANAVSAIAETRILVKRTAQEAPWRIEESREAESKLAEADRQVQQNNPGAALFFVYRARRIAELGLIEAKFVNQQRDTYFVEGDQASLRAGPTTEGRVIRVLGKATPVFPERSENDWMLVRVISGSAGWIHTSMIRR